MIFYYYGATKKRSGERRAERTAWVSIRVPPPPFSILNLSFFRTVRAPKKKQVASIRLPECRQGCEPGDEELCEICAECELQSEQQKQQAEQKKMIDRCSRRTDHGHPAIIELEQRSPELFAEAYEDAEWTIERLMDGM